MAPPATSARHGPSTDGTRVLPPASTPLEAGWLERAHPAQPGPRQLGDLPGEHLGIEVEVSNRDQDSFMDALTAKPTEILFGYVSYGMDFLDPTNMLGVWLAGGRHSWANDEFDEKVLAAASFLGPTEERLALFKEAERILVEDVPGVFIYHETPVQLIKPWVRGDALEPDESGNTSIHWPRYTTMSTVPGGLYITDEVPDR